MAWHLTDDPDEFWSAAGEFLRSRPLENTMPLTLLDTLRNRDLHYFGPADPFFGWYAPDGRVLGACLQTPPHPLLLTTMPAGAAPQLAALLAGRPLPGVNGLDSDARAFAAAWSAAAEVRLQTRLFRLDELTPPAPAPPGRARVAEQADRQLLIDWLTAFHQHLGESMHDPAHTADDKISYGGITLWEVDGRAVSLAGRTRIEAGVGRIAPVYTPAELRGRGYAGAVTATVSRQVLDAGAADVVLFTDLANPTSNALYERLGYRPIEDRTVLEFAI
jgi:predicted GNAT family acetyltransferase